MANDKNFKVKNSLLAGRYLQQAGTESSVTVNTGPTGIFSTDLYTGTSSTQTITNDIDLSTDGGLVWIKNRNNAVAHSLTDTARGADILYTNSTAAPGSGTWGVNSFNSDGFTITDADALNNNTTGNYVAWSFKKESDFFDVVTWTGDSTSSRDISHSLGSVPGCIIAKRTGGADGWFVYHKDLTDNTYYLRLDTTDAETTSSNLFVSEPTSTNFSIGTDINGSLDGSFVGYVLGHDTSADGNIYCGSYIGNGSDAGPEINLGWEPSWIMARRVDSTGYWTIVDSVRGMVTSGDDKLLYPNTTDAEQQSNRFIPTDTGFQVNSTNAYVNASGGTYIFIAIRKEDTTYTETLDLSTGHYFDVDLQGNSTIELSNPPASGKAYAAQIEVTGGVSSGYDFSTASYDSKSLDTSSEQSNPLAIQISEDGTKFYVAGSTGDEMHQYTLSTPYDITTATYENVSFDHSSENGTIQGIRFANDPTDTTTYGKRMYLLGTATSKVVIQYTLSTAWDISTATFDSPTFSVATQVTGTPRSLSFSATGDSFFVLDESTDVIYQYDMTTPWDLSTASYASKSLDVTAEETIPQGHSFNADGTELFVIGESGGDVNKYTLTTGFDISTASFDSVVFTPGSEFTKANVRDAVFGDEGAKFYLVENVGSIVLQYSSGTTATITWPDSIKWELGLAGVAPDNGKISLISVSTVDGGTTYYGSEIGREIE